MEFVAILAGFGVSAVCWVLLIKSMKINGRSLWWRHLAPALWSPLSFAGGTLLVGSLLGMNDANGEPWGFSGIISALTILIPVLVALGVSWGAAKRKALTQSPKPTPSTNDRVFSKKGNDISPALSPKPTPSPQPTPSPKPAPKPTPEPEPKPPPAPKRTPEPKPAQRETPPPAPRPTGRLMFIYCDAEGKESTRELTNFTLKGSKVQGFCLDRNAIRTFHLDRVVTFLEGEEQLYATEQRTPQRSEAPDPVRAGDPEITFSGFDAKTRASLEKTAKAHGFVVRKSVTKNLDYFVAGQRRSGSKLNEAEDKPGCSVIDKEGFLWLVATGEISS